MDENVTEFTWNAGSTFDPHVRRCQYCSNNFALKSDSSAKFALFMDCTEGYYASIKFGVIAKNITERKPVNLRIQFWVNDTNGGKVHEHVAESFAFMNIDQKCEFGSIPGAEQDFLKYVCSSKLSVSFGCKLTYLNPDPVQVPSFQNSLNQKLWDLYEKGIGFDMIILAGGKEFKVSRYVLGAHSNVFQQMFSPNFKEGITGKAELKDITAPAMEAFIKWMYIGEISDNTVIEELFVAADKYMIDDLKLICANLMTKSMTEENTAHRLVLASKHNDKKFKQKILNFIHDKGTDFMDKIYQSDAWRDYLNMVRGAGN